MDTLPNTRKTSLSIEQESKIFRYKIVAFSVTAILYACVHATRTSWAYTKPTFAEDVEFKDYQMGIIDSSFLTAYAIGLYISGWLGDRMSLKTLITIGLIIAASSYTIFAIFQSILKIESISISSLLFIINGLGQSTGFPVCVAILTNWFSSKEKGIIFGLWLTNTNIGNILGQQIGKLIIDKFQLSWPIVIYLSSLLVLFCTGVMYIVLPTHPHDLSPKKKTLDEQLVFKRLIELKEGKENEAQNAIEQSNGEDPKGILHENIENQKGGTSFIEALRSPGVLLYSLVFFCVKASIYGLLFWLPTYLKIDVGFKAETADLLAAFEFGSIVGVIATGFISDKIGDRSKTIMWGLYIAVLSFILINFFKSPQNKGYLMILLFISGGAVGGPAGLISGAISSDLGESSTKGKSTATITGIIDGSGTLGAATAQILIPFFRNNCFLFFSLITLVAGILTPMAKKQIATKKQIPQYSSVEVEIQSQPMVEQTNK